MFATLTSIVCFWFALFLPAFATFKALKRPIDEAKIEHLAKYWTVLSVVVSFEYLLEWFVSWFPFYFEVKTLFLLFISLPQSQGSTFIFDNYLQPFFAKNEASIDSGIIALQASILNFLRTRLALLWELFISVVNKSPATNGQTPATGGNAQAPPSLVGLWNTYGPSLISALQPGPKPAAASTPAPSAPGTPGLAPSNSEFVPAQ